MAEERQEAFVEFFTEFVNESDRAAVVLGAAKLDYLLCELISKVILPPRNKKSSDKDNSSNDEEIIGELGAFGIKINFAYRLGLIDESFVESLHIIKKLRNHFAHKPGGCRLTASPYKRWVGSLIGSYKKFDRFSKGVEFIETYSEGKVIGILAEFRAILALMVAQLEYAISVAQLIVPADPLISEKQILES